MTEIVAILTCFNRREKTLACLRALFDQHVDADVTLSAVMVDDGSTDGTADAVRAAFPAVTVVDGSGSLYWAAGMRAAEDVARRQRSTHTLWLNDDVLLRPDAVATLLRVADANPTSVVVGAVVDPAAGNVTYSGLRRRDWHPMRWERVVPAGEDVDVDAFNGNVVLVPQAVYEAVGPIDGGFAHAAADLDYGLRVRRRGLRNVLAGTVVGECALGPTRAATRHDSFRARWRALVGPKGTPPRSYARYLRRHGGPAWPLFWIASYLKAIPWLLSSGRRSVPGADPCDDVARADDAGSGA